MKEHRHRHMAQAQSSYKRYFEATFIFKQKFVNCSHWTRVHKRCVCVSESFSFAIHLICCQFVFVVLEKRALSVVLLLFITFLLPLPSLLFFRHYFIVVILFLFFSSFVCSFSQRYYQITFWVKIFAPYIPHIAHAHLLREFSVQITSIRTSDFIFAGAVEPQTLFYSVFIANRIWFSRKKCIRKIKPNHTNKRENEDIWSILLKCLFSIRFGLKEFKLLKVKDCVRSHLLFRCWYGPRLLENCEWRKNRIEHHESQNIVISEWLLPSTSNARIKSNRIESNQIEYVRVKSRCAVDLCMHKYYIHIWWCWPLC